MSLARHADIHCHLLPAWDDGPKNFDEVLTIARRAVQCGITDIFVTPHVGRDLSGMGVQVAADAGNISRATQLLQEELRCAGLELALWPGAELVIAPDLPQRIEREPYLTLGGWNRHVLVELTPGTPWTNGVDDILFQIALRGVTPIVAHPERYIDVQRDVQRVQRAASRGVLFQLTAASLLGRGAVRDTSRRLLEGGLISFIASDAHSPHDVFPHESMEVLRSLVGSDVCGKIFNNSLALLPDSDYTVQSATSLRAKARDKSSSPTNKNSSIWSKFHMRRDRVRGR